MHEIAWHQTDPRTRPILASARYRVYLVHRAPERPDPVKATEGNRALAGGPLD
jgi:hypothetical protein